MVASLLVLGSTLLQVQLSQPRVSARHCWLRLDVQKPASDISVGFQGKCTMPYTGINSAIT